MLAWRIFVTWVGRGGIAMGIQGAQESAIGGDGAIAGQVDPLVPVDVFLFDAEHGHLGDAGVGGEQRGDEQLFVGVARSELAVQGAGGRLVLALQI